MSLKLVRIACLSLVGTALAAGSVSADSGNAFAYLGVGRGIPSEIAKAGPGASVVFAWPGNTSSTRWADGWCSVYNHAGGGWGDDCSAGAGLGGFLNCSVQSEFGGSGSDPEIDCSAKGDSSSGGAQGQSVFCSAMANGSGEFCSVGNGGNHTASCSVEENGNGNGSQSMSCSANDDGSAAGNGASGCSVEAGNAGSNDSCSATGSDSSGAQGSCSAGSGSGGDDSCSVVEGSGDSCTAAAGSTATCSTSTGGTGSCSSFAAGGGGPGGLGGAQVDDGNAVGTCG